MDKKMKVLIALLYLLVALLILDISYLIYTSNQPQKLEYYNEDHMIKADYKEILNENRINTLNKITNLENINWGYYNFSRKTINGGYIKTDNDTHTIVINPSLKNKEKQKQSTILHEFSHYLLNEHKDSPALYQTLNTKEKEIMTDITAYTLDDALFNGKTFKGSYISKRKIKKHKTFQKEIENFINLIQKELDDND